MFWVPTSALLGRYGQLARWASLLATCSGCTFDLPAVIGQTPTSSPTPGGAGAGGSDAGPVSGNGGAGGGSGGGSEPACPDGSSSPECPPSCDLDACQLVNATAKCAPNGTCAIAECSEGFVDCDGQVENGCEANFRASSDGGRFVAHQLAESDELPAGGYSWDSHPVYSISAKCTLCDDQMSREPPDPDEAPTTDDLLAVFQAGWNSGGLHFRVRVFDDDPYTVEAPATGASEREVLASDPRQQDDIEVVYFGPPSNEDGAGADDHHLYVGFDGRTASSIDKQYDELITFESVETAKGCRFADLRLGPNFLSGLDGPGQGLETKAGQIFTFNIGVNDFSPPAEATPVEPEPVAEWRNRRFYKDPLNNYWFIGEKTMLTVGELHLDGPAPMATPSN